MTASRRPKVFFRDVHIAKRLEACKLAAAGCGWHPNNVIAFATEIEEAFTYEEAMAIIHREFDVVT